MGQELSSTQAPQRRKLTLDLGKWRCGQSGGGDSSLGEGVTQLLNSEGYMCCLGQFAEQAGVPKKKLLYKGIPSELAEDLGKVYDPLFVEEDLTISRLALELVFVNDSSSMAVSTKINRIRALLNVHGVDLEIIQPSPKPLEVSCD